MNTGDSALLLERRAHGRRRPPAPLRVAFDLFFDLAFADLDRLLACDLIQDQGTTNRLARHVPLAFAERAPIDTGFARVDVLLHQPPGEVLEPAVDLPLDE